MVCSFWGLDDCFAHVQTAECKPLLFSELGLLPQQHRHSPEPPSASSSRVPAHHEAYWRLEATLERLNAPIPERPSIVTARDPDDSEPLEPRNPIKRRVDSQMPRPKRVKLSYSTTSSGIEEGSSSSKALPSNPNGGVNPHHPPLVGVVVFVDSRLENGYDTSKYWGDMLRNLGARVRKIP